MKLFEPVPGFNFHVSFVDPADSPATPSGFIANAAAVTMAIAASFSEVSGLEAELEVEEYHQGGANFAPLRFPKWGRFPALIFKRGVTPNSDLWDWSNQVLQGGAPPVRKSGMIILLDRNSPMPGIVRLPIAVWIFKNGLPTRMRGPELNAKSGDIAIESLEVSHEGLMRLGLAAVPDLGDTMAAFGF
jgi:phage tail-like protein